MKYSQIKLNDITNSDTGINMSVWTQFCPHRCFNCFNPKTWSEDGGIEFTHETLMYIFDNINKHNINRNLSVLGGEPLSDPNIEGTIYLCKSFKDKYPNKKIYLWTGYTYENLNETQKKILPYLDVLVDGRFEEDLKDISLKLRGSSNQRIIDVQKSLKENKIILYESVDK
ncbi:MAG: anaerobic ribonucleoside-triphosphate reductase activating protein [Sarcina sp.]